jgi:predicted Zn-ribbon and HTH transcriptional regulator
VHEDFPEIPSIKMLTIWCKLQKICGFEDEDGDEKENTPDCSKHRSTLMNSIENMVNQKIWEFAEKVHKEFPHISINEILSIWCELQQICGFEFPDREVESPKQEPKFVNICILKVEKRMKNVK